MKTGILAKMRLMTKAGVWARAAGLAAVLAAGGCWNLILQEAATVRFTEGESGERLFESAVGADFTIPAPKDQTFNGWEAESGEVLLPGQSFKVDKTLVTFRAVFVKKGNCTVQYLVGGKPLYQYSYPPGAEVRVEDCLPTVNEPESGDESAASNGNVFLGWRLESGGELLAAGVLLFPRIQADARLNAVYGAPRQYTVTYLRGDSSGQMPNPNTQTGLTGSFVPIGQGYLSKKGCLFGGWKDAAGTVYAPGETYSLSGNLSLLPVWLTECHVLYNRADSDSGSPPESRTFPAGTKIVIPGNTGNLAKAGFMFSGWRRDGADKDTAYAPGDTLEVSGDLSLSPVWATGYRVWYNGTGATGGSPPEDRTLYPAGTGTSVRGNEGSLVQAGYLFDGWRDDATGTAYAPGEAITVSGNLSLSPVWQRLYKIQYGNGGATGGSPPTDTALYSAGAQATVQGEGSLVRTGYLFDGWQDARGARYTPGAVIPVYGDLSLSPAWQKLYKVQYAGMADRGSPPKDPAYYPEGASAAVLDNEGELRRIGFVFAGWNTSPDGTGTGYAPGERLAVQGDAALYAKWEEKYRSVTFDADGGSPTEGVSVPNSGALGNLPATPSKGELFFAGWYANRDGASPPLTAATVVEADLTVYALWTDARYVRAYGGADTNAGTAGAPLATLAEALRRADPQYAPASGATPCRKIRVFGSLALPGTVSVSTPGDEEVVIDGTGGGELSAAGGAYALRADAASIRLENIAVRGFVLGSNAKAVLHNVTVAPPAGGETGVEHGGELLTLSGNTTVGGVLRLVRQGSRLHVEGALSANKLVATLAPWSYLPGTILPLTEDAPNPQISHFAVSQPPGILTFKLLYTEDSRMALESVVPAAYGSAASSAYWLENPDGSIDEVHAFTRAGADNLAFSEATKNALERGNAAAVTALIVGGGGGGGACWGESPAVFSDTDYVSAGGGGAGEFRLARTELTSRSAINVPISVGGGGQGGMRGHTGSRNEVSGTPGGDSLFGEYAARGGGGGGGIWDKETPRSGGPGGRKADGGGGGAGGYGWTSLLYWHYESPGGKGPGGGIGGNLASLPATLTTSGRCWGGGGGGGGGAGGPGGSGGNASKTNEMWGAYGRGGTGADSDISGTLLTFAAGGNGGAPENPKDYDAGANTGSGGAGGYASSGAGRRGGNGGSGIVVVRIRAASPRKA